jgi:hypothetical protein
VPPLRTRIMLFTRVSRVGLGETVGGKIGVRPNESHDNDFERDFEESREPWVRRPTRGSARVAGLPVRPPSRCPSRRQLSDPSHGHHPRHQ